MAQTADSAAAESNPDATTDDANSTRKPSALSRFGRGTIKVVGRLSAADVLIKDSKRMRPRHPQLWKDIWNARAILKDAKAREKALGIHPDQAPIWKARRNAMLTAATGLCVVAYGLFLISSHDANSNLPWVGKFGMVSLVAIGLLQAILYGWISLKLTQRQIARHSQKSPKQTAPSHHNTVRNTQKRSKAQ